MTGTAVTIRLEVGADGAGANGALTGTMTPAAGTSIPSGFNPLGHFETSANTLLNLELGGPQIVGGHLVYVEVD